MKNIKKSFFLNGVCLVALCAIYPSLGYGVDYKNPESNSMPVIRGGDTSLLSSKDPSKEISKADPADNAGIMNYCVQNNYLDQQVGMVELHSYNKKISAVLPNETGNIAYATGTSGTLNIGRRSYNIALSTLPVRLHTCQAVAQYIHSALNKPSK